MSTPQLHIEFAHLDGTTQVAIFDALPTWATLAARVQTLFDIPETAAALAYVDADGDEITMSSEDELREFLTTLPGNTDTTTLLFAVRDLRELRASEDSDRTLSTPPGSPPGERADDAPPHVRGPSVFPMRAIFAARGRGGLRGGRGGGHDGLSGHHLHGYHHFGHGHHGPPGGMFPAHVPLSPSHPRWRSWRAFVSHKRGPIGMNHPVPPPHSASPEVHADAPTPAPAPGHRNGFDSFPFHGGCDRGHHHGHHRHHEYYRHQRGGAHVYGHGRGRGPEFSMRGGPARGRGGRGGPVHIALFPHEFVGIPEAPFGFDGRGRGGFAARGRGMHLHGICAVVDL